MSLPPETNIEMKVTVKLHTEKTAIPSAPVAPSTMRLSRIALTKSKIVLTTDAIPLVLSSPRYAKSFPLTATNFSVRFLKKIR